MYMYIFSEEPETRDAWWMEIRTEIRSHMRAMGCHAVIGYSEHTSIWLVWLCCPLVLNENVKMIQLSCGYLSNTLGRHFISIFLTLCIPGNLFSAGFYKITIFQKFFQQYH